MAKKRYSIIDKMKTVWLLRDQTITGASKTSGVPESTIRYWQQNYDSITAEYYKYLHDEGVHKVLVAQNRLADKIGDVVNAMTKDKMQNAPLNQLASTAGILIDRFLRIHDAKEIEESDKENRYIIEYYDANTGKITRTPRWTEDDSIDESALHDSYLWQTLWENRTGEAGDTGNGSEGQDGLVARTHISNGSAGLARPEDGDEERDWHPG